MRNWIFGLADEAGLMRPRTASDRGTADSNFRSLHYTRAGTTHEASQAQAPSARGRRLHGRAAGHAETIRDPGSVASGDASIALLSSVLSPLSRRVGRDPVA